MSQEKFILAGVGNVTLYDQGSGDMIVTSKTLTDSGINFTITAEDIRGGMANKLLGQYFHDSGMGLTLTDSLFSLEYSPKTFFDGLESICDILRLCSFKIVSTSTSAPGRFTVVKATEVISLPAVALVVTAMIFSSLIGYLTICVFLVLTGLMLWVFRTGFNILDYGYAGIDGLFFIGPFLYLFLIPAITMRMFAEERRTGTIELLLTKPLGDWTIIFAKFLAGLTLVFIALLPTLDYYFSVFALGDPVGTKPVSK